MSGFHERHRRWPEWPRARSLLILLVGHLFSKNGRGVSLHPQQTDRRGGQHSAQDVMACVVPAAGNAAGGASGSRDGERPVKAEARILLRWFCGLRALLGHAQPLVGPFTSNPTRIDSGNSVLQTGASPSRSIGGPCVLLLLNRQPQAGTAHPFDPITHVVQPASFPPSSCFPIVFGCGKRVPRGLCPRSRPCDGA